MKRPNREDRLQGQKGRPAGTPSDRKEMEKLEGQLVDHEARMRRFGEGERAGHVVVPNGWIETGRR